MLCFQFWPSLISHELSHNRHLLLKTGSIGREREPTVMGKLVIPTRISGLNYSDDLCFSLISLSL